MGPDPIFPLIHYRSRYLKGFGTKSVRRSTIVAWEQSGGTAKVEDLSIEEDVL